VASQTRLSLRKRQLPRLSREGEIEIPLLLRYSSNQDVLVRRKGVQLNQMAESTFSVGHRYTREAVADLIALPSNRRKGGTWVTGYTRYNNEIFIFCNVGVPGRTGHDYPNRWLGKKLVWFGKTHASADQPLIGVVTAT
jgi:hypothetical protein